jgi:hypothetical protein
VYAGYTFSSIVRHGATATISLTRVPSDRKERVGNGMHMTFTAGGNGFVVGGGWARCALSSLPGCLEIRGIVGRTRTASDDLEAQEIYLGAEGGLTFLWLRLSTGVAFPARESGVKHPMFVGSIGFVVPIWGLGRN